MESYRKMVVALGPKVPIMKTPSVHGLGKKGLFAQQCPGQVILTRYHLEERYFLSHKQVFIPDVACFKRDKRNAGGGSMVDVLTLDLALKQELNELLCQRKGKRPLTIDYSVILSRDIAKVDLPQADRKLTIAVVTCIRDHLAKQARPIARRAVRA